MIPLAVLKRHLKVDDDIVADDELIKGYEEAAVQIMQNETGRFLGALGEVTELLSGNGWAGIWLQGSPIIDEDYSPFVLERRNGPGGTWEAVPSTDFEVDGYRLYPLAYWAPGLRTLRATYTAGYAEDDDEPADIRQAVRELVSKMYEHRKPFVAGTTIADLPYSVQEIIRANRVIVV